MNFTANLLAVKFITLFGSGTSPDAIQRGGQAVRIGWSAQPKPHLHASRKTIRYLYVI